jgi:hypothetical protein
VGTAGVGLDGVMSELATIRPETSIGRPLEVAKNIKGENGTEILYWTLQLTAARPLASEEPGSVRNWPPKVLIEGEGS